ncbi:isochorismate synthase [Microbacterium sediminicola]|uniref:isochorismate synthase n=1 Tax=Microbacterium sediminicola TaxID=415210 RepID=UPI0031DDC26B
MEPSRLPPLVVETRPIDPVADPVSYADPLHPLAWLRRDEAIVGVGPAVIELSLDAATAATQWREVVGRSQIDDTVGMPGSGLIAFGILPFDPRSSAGGHLVIPRTIVGTRQGRSWITRVRRADEPTWVDGAGLPPAIPYGPHWSATVGPGALDPEGYQHAVRAGVSAIASGRVQKVVLARDLVGTVPAAADLRRLVRALASNYPDTWTFAVDGLIGASPETLVTVQTGTVTARVLAGTIARGADAESDASASAALAISGKDRDEHRFAVASVTEALEHFTSDLDAPSAPHLLELPNLWHLATDVVGHLSNGASSLDLVRALHPTAAVAGTPTDAAIDLIRELEPFDRGRYAGPVGWVDAHGDGEWAIALRCAQLGGTSSGRVPHATGTIPVVAHAGAGIVAESDPESELLETRVKFRPIVDALA